MTEPASTPGPDGAESGRERILDAAAELLVRQGFGPTSMRHIATAAGIKAGSVYYHFDSKDSLVTEVLRQGIAVMDTAFDEVAARSHATPRDRLAAHVRAHLGALFEHGPYTAAHVTAFPFAPPDVQSAIVPVRDAYERRWAELLVELADGGDLRDDLPLGLARLLAFGAMNSSVEWFEPGRGNLDQLADAMVELVWSGLGRNRATERGAA